MQPKLISSYDVADTVLGSALTVSGHCPGNLAPLNLICVNFDPVPYCLKVHTVLP